MSSNGRTQANGDVVVSGGGGIEQFYADAEVLMTNYHDVESRSLKTFKECGDDPTLVCIDKADKLLEEVKEVEQAIVGVLDQAIPILKEKTDATSRESLPSCCHTGARTNGVGSKQDAGSQSPT